MGSATRYSIPKKKIVKFAKLAQIAILSARITELMYEVGIGTKVCTLWLTVGRFYGEP